MMPFMELQNLFLAAQLNGEFSDGTKGSSILTCLSDLHQLEKMATNTILFCCCQDLILGMLPIMYSHCAWAILSFIKDLVVR